MKSIGDNRVVTLFAYVLEGLQTRYDEQESKNMAAILFQHLFGFSRADLVIKANERLSESEMLEVHFALKELKKGKPIQHLVGMTPFYGLEIEVNHDVLIPRPETEELVDWIVSSHKNDDWDAILDVGTGSGCIALALKSVMNEVEVFACDTSKAALNVARNNASRLNLHVQFQEWNVLEKEIPLSAMDLLVSNPPYIPLSEKEEMEEHVVEHEPELALFVPNDDALLFYRTLAEQGLNLLKTGGWIYFEMHHKMASGVGELLFNLGYGAIEIKTDMQGKQRMIRAKKEQP